MPQIPEPIKAMLDSQYGHELSNHFKYRKISSALEAVGLTGAAGFFGQEAKGERGHAEKVAKYISERNEAIGSIQIDTGFEVPLDLLSVFRASYNLEVLTTERLIGIYQAAYQLGDIQTVIWLGDLIAEQTEEENLHKTILDRISVVLGESFGLDGSPMLAESEIAGLTLAGLDDWIGGKVK